VTAVVGKFDAANPCDASEISRASRTMLIEQERREVNAGCVMSFVRRSPMNFLGGVTSGISHGGGEPFAVEMRLHFRVSDFKLANGNGAIFQRILQFTWLLFHKHIGSC